jgi:glycosyltransferase involved in cell wall biosynthesis
MRLIEPRAATATTGTDTAGSVATISPPRVDVVVPTVGRSSLIGLLGLLARTLPRDSSVIVVDDRPSTTRPLALRVDDRFRVVRSGGRGPAAARNVGWHSTSAPWIAFVDDDVEPSPQWGRRLLDDLVGATSDVAAVQGHIEVPLPTARRPSDWERNVAGLDGATWITADMAVRRTALRGVRGFDERFRRAYREDTDLALRLLDAGWRLTVGKRRVRHPVRPAPWWISVRLQRGNADDVLLERLHGRRWRRRLDVAHGTLSSYPATTASGVVALVALVAGRRRAATLAACAWAIRTARFAWRRAAPGPRDTRELAAVLATSVAIPPVACYHRIRGSLRWRGVVPHTSRGVA